VLDSKDAAKPLCLSNHLISLYNLPNDHQKNIRKVSIKKKVRIIKEPLHSINRRGWDFSVGIGTGEKPNSVRLSENVQMQGFRNPEE
jgi:hypothetical protein